jgi:hypothetical protein
MHLWQTFLSKNISITSFANEFYGIRSPYLESETSQFVEIPYLPEHF